LASDNYAARAAPKEIIMHYLDPSRSSHPTYARVRRETLNFEAYGGERSVAEAASPAPLAQILPFSSATRSWITVNIHRKDVTMTDTPQDHEGFNERATGGPSGSAHERVETYSPAGALHARLATTSGDIVVRASDSPNVTVTLRASSPKYDYLLDAADVIFDAASNTLTIRTLPKGVSMSSRGLRIGPPRSWLEFGSSDLDVELEVPRGTALDVATVSGDTSLIGSLGVVTVKSVSGDVIANDTSDALEVQTASGDVISGHVLTTLKCKSSSGDVVCHGAAADTEIISASGDVVLSADQPGSIIVRNVSGDVVVRVARGLAVDINGNTVSGSLASNIDLDGDGGDTTSDEELVIKITTVSGDIRIAKAS
jgi:DUF4097 and DUF4098 domain-containing protein YvlB